LLRAARVAPRESRYSRNGARCARVPPGGAAPSPRTATGEEPELRLLHSLGAPRRIATALFAIALAMPMPAAAADAPAAAPTAAPAAAATVAAPRIEVFVREGCPHCAKAEAFLAQLARERPDVVIAIRDVSKEPAALERLKEIAKAVGGGARVPAIYAGGQLILGYSDEAHTDNLIRAAIGGRRPAAAGVADNAAGACDAEDALTCAAPAAAASPEPVPERFEVTLFGRTISLDDVGLPAFTIAMGLLDGFNPCSMWVLIMMISLLAPLNDRKRMLAVAGTFVAVEGIAYFVFMAAWLNLFLLIGISRWSQLVIAALAIVAGAINLKDFWAFGWGVSLSIPAKAKPGIYARMRSILHAENLTAAILGTIVLAVLVQIVEFMCTSGFPALFTRILTLKQLDTATYYGYLLLYNVFYMLDDVIVLAIGVITLSRHRLQEKEGRWLKAISGVVMLGLGAYLIFDGF
jgi:glutaredoxin